MITIFAQVISTYFCLSIPTFQKKNHSGRECGQVEWIIYYYCLVQFTVMIEFSWWLNFRDDWIFDVIGQRPNSKVIASQQVSLRLKNLHNGPWWVTKFVIPFLYWFVAHWSPWGPWSGCAQTCDAKSPQIRYRECIKVGNLTCPGPSNQTKSCETRKCCKWPAVLRIMSMLWFHGHFYVRDIITVVPMNNKCPIIAYVCQNIDYIL